RELPRAARPYALPTRSFRRGRAGRGARASPRRRARPGDGARVVAHVAPGACTRLRASGGTDRGRAAGTRGGGPERAKRLARRPVPRPVGPGRGFGGGATPRRGGRRARAGTEPLPAEEEPRAGHPGRRTPRGTER